MLELYAKNPKQLDICLRLLYAEKIDFTVSVREDHKGKVFYTVTVDLDTEDARIAIKEKYRLMTQ